MKTDDLSMPPEHTVLFYIIEHADIFNGRWRCQMLSTHSTTVEIDSLKPNPQNGKETTPSEPQPYAYPGRATILTLGGFCMTDPAAVVSGPVRAKSPGTSSATSSTTGPAEEEQTGPTPPSSTPGPDPWNATTTHPSSLLLTTTPRSPSPTPGGSPSANLTTGAPAAVNPRNRAGVSPPL